MRTSLFRIARWDRTPDSTETSLTPTGSSARVAHHMTDRREWHTRPVQLHMSTGHRTSSLPPPPCFHEMDSSSAASSSRLHHREATSWIRPRRRIRFLKLWHRYFLFVDVLVSGYNWSNEGDSPDIPRELQAEIMTTSLPALRSAIRSESLKEGNRHQSAELQGFSPVQTTSGSRRAVSPELSQRTETDASLEQEPTIRFVYDPDFEDPQKTEEILAPLSDSNTNPRTRRCSDAKTPGVDELCRFTPLRADEERHLFRLMNYLKYRAATFEENNGLESEESSMARRGFLQRAVATRNQILQCNQRLAVSVAKKFVRPSLRIDELLSEANEILIKAIDCFDVSRGFRFSTYASHSMYRHLLRVARQHDRELKRREMLGAESLVVAAGTDQPEPPGIEPLLEHLTSAERQIAKLRFGLTEAGRPHSFREIGEKRGVSGERIRQIFRESLVRLRATITRRKDLLSMCRQFV